MPGTADLEVPTQAGLLKGPVPVWVHGAPWRLYGWLWRNIWMERSSEWAVVHGCEAWGRELGRARSQVELGGWGGPARRGSGKRAEGWALSCSVSRDIGERGAQRGLSSTPSPRCTWPEQQPAARRLEPLCSQGPAPPSPPSSLPGPDAGRPPGQSSRRAPCPHTGHAGIRPGGGQV